MSTLQGARVLVTGGAGFIGSHLVDRLLAHTGVAQVRVLDNLVNGSEKNLEDRRDDPRMILQIGDIRDETALATALMDSDVVFHLACLGVRHSLHDPVENHSVNASGTLAVLQMARSRGVSGFIHVSSSEVFGTAQFAPMNEQHPTWPETVYGGSKLAGEAYSRAFHNTYGLPVIVARPFNTYGPRSHFEGDSGEVIPRTIVRLLNGERPLIFGDGEQTRDFMHVRDTARGLVALAECNQAVGRTVNLGAGAEISMNVLCQTIAAAAGRPELTALHLPDRPGDVRRLIVDASLMRSLTGFGPEVSFTSGIAELVSWFEDSGTSPLEMLAQVEERNWADGQTAGAR
ncbi:MAG: GDP-mannose 4,6-dehydratase [Arthrobacter sp.]